MRCAGSFHSGQAASCARRRFSVLSPAALTSLKLLNSSGGGGGEHLQGCRVSKRSTSDPQTVRTRTPRIPARATAQGTAKGAPGRPLAQAAARLPARRAFQLRSSAGWQPRRHGRGASRSRRPARQAACLTPPPKAPQQGTPPPWWAVAVSTAGLRSRGWLYAAPTRHETRTQAPYNVWLALRASDELRHVFVSKSSTAYARDGARRHNVVLGSSPPQGKSRASHRAVRGGIGVCAASMRLLR